MLLSGCMYSLDVEGKQCNATHRCPNGYACMPGADGGESVCVRGGDGGTDGGDTGTCVEGEKACNPGEPLSLFECTGGKWESTGCPENQYCFYTGASGDAVGCVADCTQSSDCLRDTHWCNTTSHHCELKGNCEPPGETHCLFPPGGDILETCDPDSRFWQQTECGTGGYCHERYLRCLPECSTDADCEDLPDDVNPEPNSCDLSNGKCRYLEFCDNNNDCSMGQEYCVSKTSVGGTCVLIPENISTASVDCFKSAVPDTGSVTDCDMEGYVTEFAIASDLYKITASVGLSLEVHRRDLVLAGDTSSPIKTVTVEEADPGPGTDDNGYYRATSIPCKTPLVFVVRGGMGTGAEFVTNYVYGFYLRADRCEQGSGTIQWNVPVMRKSTYDSYAQGGVSLPVNANKGLFMARISDCTPNRIGGATVAISIHSEQEFFLNNLVPEPDATTTLTGGGFFGAANAESIRGVLGALVKDSTTSYAYLGPHPVRVFPASASLLIIWKEPLEP